MNKQCNYYAVFIKVPFASWSALLQRTSFLYIKSTQERKSTVLTGSDNFIVKDFLDCDWYFFFSNDISLDSHKWDLSSTVSYQLLRCCCTTITQKCTKQSQIEAILALEFWHLPNHKLASRRLFQYTHLLHLPSCIVQCSPICLSFSSQLYSYF